MNAACLDFQGAANDNPNNASGEIPLLYRVPLQFTPQIEGGFVVTSPMLPELITEGDSLEEAWKNVSDALAAVVEIYEESGTPLPVGIAISRQNSAVSADFLVATS